LVSGRKLHGKERIEIQLADRSCFCLEPAADAEEPRDVL